MLFPQQPQNDQDTPVQSVDMFGVPTTDEPYDRSWLEGDTAPGQNTGQPAQGAPDSQSPQDNDTVRYQYWQSQHDTLKNQYEELKQQNQVLQQRLGTVEQTVTKAPEPQEEEFPDPPEAPAKPYGFSPQEAMSDPSSESARYMVALAEHNNVMNQYNLYRADWLNSKQTQEIQKLYAKDSTKQQEEIRRAQVSAQVNQAIAAVQKNYGVDYDTAIDFVNTMSDNASFTMDNLFELYKMKKGVYPEKGANGRYSPAPNPQPFSPWGVPVAQGNAMPSQDFQQRQRAQSIPPIMGVHNAQGNAQVDPMIAAFQQTIRDSNNQNIY